MLPPVDEKWLPVTSHVGFYEVSNLGRVRSIARQHQLVTPYGTFWRNVRERIRKPHMSAGYPTVSLSRENNRREGAVHILMLEAFVGPRPIGMQACHRDDCRTNNVLDNLYWGNAKTE